MSVLIESKNYKKILEKTYKKQTLQLKDLQKLIESEKDKAEIRERISTTLGIIGMIGGRTFL